MLGTDDGSVSGKRLDPELGESLGCSLSFFPGSTGAPGIAMGKKRELSVGDELGFAVVAELGVAPRLLP